MPASSNVSNLAGAGRKDDIVIAIMGTTGSGKSTLVNLLTGTTTIRIGDTLTTETSQVQALSFAETTLGRNVRVIETPSFDDSRETVTNTEILKNITNFLLKEYDDQRKLHGLVFVQRISDVRFFQESKRNLQMFQCLCGTTSYKNVVIATTFWDTVEREEGAWRDALLQKHLLDLVQGGAQFIKVDRTSQDGAHNIHTHILGLTPTTIQIQREIREEGKTLEQTAAGFAQREEIDRLISRCQKDVAELEIDMEKAETSGELKELEELKMERAELQKTLGRLEDEKAVLKKGLTSNLKVKFRGTLDMKNPVMPPPKRLAHAKNTIILPPDSVLKNWTYVQSKKYPPHLKSIPSHYSTNILDIFDFNALVTTAASLVAQPVLMPQIRQIVPKCRPYATTTMRYLTKHNQELHHKAREAAHEGQTTHKHDMYFNASIGQCDNWFVDAVFSQQQFTGTNPTTITLANRRWIEELRHVSITQHRGDLTRLLEEDPQSLYVQDYSDYRSIMNLSPNAEFTCGGRYGCSSVALFHLEPEGTLHPLAITIDYRSNMDNSVTIINRRITSKVPGNEEEDWPWRYAKMCVQVSDWLRHEVTVHLVNTHLVEEVVIVAIHRSFIPSHVIFKLLEPHWSTTLSLNASARSTLVPKIIMGMTAFTPQQIYAFLKDAYRTFDWTGLYVPNDIRNRGFPIDHLDDAKYHNYGYARNILGIWNILRKFVSTVLRGAYPGGDAQVKNDRSITMFCREVRSSTGGQLSSFPIIETLDQLIDFATMYIHIASPQHTAVNYLQQYYQTFVPNKPSTLYKPLPRSLAELERFTEKDLIDSLPVHQPRDWWIMAQVPYLLSFEMPQDRTLLQYAVETASDSNSKRAPQIIRDAAKTLVVDLFGFGEDVVQYSKELDDQRVPYEVLHPSKTAISILI